jgi:hypothetical protein
MLVRLLSFYFFGAIGTVAGKGKISEPSTAGTSNLDWRCFEYYQVDRNKLHIRPNFRKIEKIKMSENLKNFETLKEKSQIQPYTQPTDLQKTGQVL